MAKTALPIRPASISDREYASMCLVYTTNIEDMDHLLAQGAEVSVHEHGTGDTALHKAAEGKLPAVLRLLQHGVLWCIMNGKGQCPAEVAQMAGHMPC
ncbi:hypothetical protein BV25DRAFT_1829974 [Artomyces pyxidatus]|uniref:Uncharacterized protein n=1 Tax=Artomyces pyxidatus TaxID=48021 RepID=A0ACB8SQP1_9AGAM|nr:hypothetical protein BV25DRAFT_1829974 [Artomyces pyxidatus]